jgi:replication factor A1
LLSTRWSIKGVVTNKTDIHNYDNARGEGSVFSFDLLDSTNEIRVIAFNNDCKRFHSIIQMKQVSIINDDFFEFSLCNTNITIYINESI